MRHVVLGVVAADASLEVQDVRDGVVELSAFDVAVADDRKSVWMQSRWIVGGLRLCFECVGYWRPAGGFMRSLMSSAPQLGVLAQLGGDWL
ncbi:hypothetical protein [Streptomyces sp. AS02]|uniref:hypothetical protein n=1 Tax=Streptomyces sp. AS02 TaxID=2938946 RepID=UPI002021322F|nr:hypothetical protein [Streptomyces sp. AS02]MCL8011315.1 hypothetical protein [Streptomyces sp. AS02]